MQRMSLSTKAAIVGSLILLGLAAAILPAPAQRSRPMTAGERAIAEALQELEESTAPMKEASDQIEAKLIRDFSKAMRNPVVQQYMGGPNVGQTQQQPPKQ